MKENQTEYFLKCIEANKPQPISLSELHEIFSLKEVQESWGLEEDTKEDYNKTFLNWQAMTYIVKFNFQSGSPGYVGPLYLLHGDHIVGPAITIKRSNKLETIDFNEDL